MAYLPMTPSACIWLIASRVAFTAFLTLKHCELIPKEMGGRHLCRLPQKAIELRSNDRVGGPGPTRTTALRGFAGASASRGLAFGGLAFDGLVAATADAHLDLLGFGFGLLGQSDLQHAL